MKSALLLHTENPKYDSWIRPVIIGIVLLPLILGLPFIFIEGEIIWAMLGVAVFLSLLISVIIPRRFEIFEDRLRIKLGGPFAMNILLSEIKDVRPASSNDAIVYWGIRFATSTSNVLEIFRRKGMDVIITPSDSALFQNELNKALQLFAAPKG